MDFLAIDRRYMRLGCSCPSSPGVLMSTLSPLRYSASNLNSFSCSHNPVAEYCANRHPEAVGVLFPLTGIRTMSAWLENYVVCCLLIQSSCERNGSRAKDGRRKHASPCITDNRQYRMERKLSNDRPPRRSPRTSPASSGCNFALLNSIKAAYVSLGITLTSCGRIGLHHVIRAMS
ncbi:hypothetical protein L226DRAFT_95439 [Lentinus tigrinus ALCF2SS1-7]|uniref:Uncharacterized protein n=1 Tax=Lentinus tigrinus ALCF2SS1-6 TaxID=1328759 RepID=A0A5C2RQY0_9APHY|nr:hypothetical protein L227DRAFT_395474 [Lentinus tigrinus ALCF2SS1-6]RPD73696.1 hypothetical protein L226DRAFT_95439 [Lentinus tigrinus ALCF2SS1-7]